MKILNFNKNGKNEYGTEVATFTLNGKKAYASFNQDVINDSTYKVYQLGGDLSTMTSEEIFKATGKHCSTTLRKAIAETLRVDLSELEYLGYLRVTHVYKGKDETVYINTMETFNEGRKRFYSTLKVPAGFNVKFGLELDKRITNKWEMVASTDSPYKKPLKTFKKKITASYENTL